MSKPGFRPLPDGYELPPLPPGYTWRLPTKGSWPRDVDIMKQGDLLAWVSFSMRKYIEDDTRFAINVASMEEGVALASTRFLLGMNEP